jgi:hypothetical protein
MVSVNPVILRDQVVKAMTEADDVGWNLHLATLEPSSEPQDQANGQVHQQGFRLERIPALYSMPFQFARRMNRWKANNRGKTVGMSAELE